MLNYVALVFENEGILSKYKHDGDWVELTRLKTYQTSFTKHLRVVYESLKIKFGDVVLRCVGDDVVVRAHRAFNHAQHQTNSELHKKRARVYDPAAPNLPSECTQAERQLIATLDRVLMTEFPSRLLPNSGQLDGNSVYLVLRPGDALTMYVTLARDAPVTYSELQNLFTHIVHDTRSADILVDGHDNALRISVHCSLKTLTARVALRTNPSGGGSNGGGKRARRTIADDHGDPLDAEEAGSVDATM